MAETSRHRVGHAFRQTDPDGIDFVRLTPPRSFNTQDFVDKKKALLTGSAFLGLKSLYYNI
ncbi:MAG: hypothetical protein ACU83N_10520 [Gammaproteobacteria bacterium]